MLGMKNSMKSFHLAFLGFFLLSFVINCLSLESKELKSHEFGNIPYHLFDPRKFKMYKNCLCNSELCVKKWNDLNQMKHWNEVYFLEQLIEANNSTNKENAEIFIVPVYFTLSAVGACGNHEDNLKDLISVLRKLFFHSEVSSKDN